MASVVLRYEYFDRSMEYFRLVQKCDPKSHEPNISKRGVNKVYKMYIYIVSDNNQLLHSAFGLMKLLFTVTTSAHTGVII